MEIQPPKLQPPSLSRCAAPLRISKAIHTISGVLKGIAADATIDDSEVVHLREWLNQFGDVCHKKPFSELATACEEALVDRKLTKDELDELLWLCDHLQNADELFSITRSSVQELHALIAAIVADNVISADELKALATWIEDHEDVIEYWPCTELAALVATVLKDSFIDAEEHKLLLDYIDVILHGADSASDGKKHHLSAVCALQPSIRFDAKTFCFTGDSKHASRLQMQCLVCDRGGAYSDSVTKTTDYLVVGADGSPYWAFSCYGRKVERAVELRREGLQILIVHEVDFWDALGIDPAKLTETAKLSASK